jgi:hypothetical protein
VHRISNKIVTTYHFPFSLFLVSTRAPLSSQQCKNSPAEYCCLVPFSLFPIFSSTWRGDRSDSEIDAAVQSNPSMPLIFSPYFHVELMQLGPAWDRNLLTWSTVHDSTVSLIPANLVPSADASSSFWVVHGAVHATSPQKFARHVQRPRSACELACSDQWPASRVQKNKKKNKYSYMGWKPLGLVWMKTFRPCLNACVSTWIHMCWSRLEWNLT